MTVKKAQLRLQVQADYNSNSAKWILSEEMRKHGQPAVNARISELERIFGSRPGTGFR